MTQTKGLLSADQANLFFNKTYQDHTAWTLTTTGTTQPEYDREYEVATITKKHSKKYSKKYWYTISVSDTEDVHYIVYHTGNLMYWLCKLLHKEPNESLSHGWVSVKKRTHLPATLGAAYQEIDKVVAGHKETMEHDEYLTEMLKTDPENLKMIEGLEKLEEGEPEAEPEGASPPTAATGPGQVYTYFNNVAVGGMGTFSGNASATSKSIAGELEAHVAEAEVEKTDKMMMEMVKDASYKEGYRATKESTEPPQ